ncbi:fructoselysine-6-P-deglycase FrlB-like protein [Rhizobium leguminosarum]|uniref:Glutamine--fructose-6-phosphate aminotransferase [isomerizing] n=2 Tax=Rhizobium/Agrobacterium group TaxID=227290 RepID=A0AAE2SWT4_RHILE|nr:fructoselysine-6-P-deglycase FrlB-like protein [Rhizobium leguminosarum]MBB4429965.1 fructoselysine-6-P-deglycase FrlB-like protein [Rhizobium esperanzae]MBB4298090.1 fructoselysine-6-P-deglycase FrlB-like protein [Rhizobium leguminosarum]MBB4309228.1 fructoselysine-6-P-deglycase FrlB-like protein [Rhizobium leguminosarum]MBB4417067.1 fructoselysine-6-P-deglycase FrlB-like protein [Rhizobium leguminosarum]
MTEETIRPAGLAAIDREMARQHADAIASYEAAQPMAATAAASLKKTGRLLLMGMGGSHAVNRAVEPLYRTLGIDAVALPLSEQLGQPLPIAGRTIFVTSQSGESAEVVRWFNETGGTQETFGLTLEGSSFLARTAPSLLGAGGTELAFAATRSLTVTFALHLAILAALGEDPDAALAVLKTPEDHDIADALAALENVGTVVTSGRRLQGVAEALALGLTELSRRPCFSLEGGQLRHGPMEMLAPEIGVVLFRGSDETASLVTVMATSAVETGAPVILFDASEQAPVTGAVTIRFAPATGLAAIFAMLPVAQRLMIAFADARVENAGTPVRSTKITRSE